MPTKAVKKAAKPSADKHYKQRIGDGALIEKTGKDWAQWFAILDKEGAATKKLEHTAIAELLSKKHHAPPWWGQMVAVGYEQARGLRGRYQNCDASFNAGCSRTFECSMDEIFRACAADAARKKWLTGDKLVISKANPGKNVRGNWNGESSLEFRFTAKGPGKTQVVVDHMKLADSADVEKMKAYWAKNLERLREQVET